MAASVELLCVAASVELPCVAASVEQPNYSGHAVSACLNGSPGCAFFAILFLGEHISRRPRRLTWEGIAFAILC